MKKLIFSILLLSFILPTFSQEVYSKWVKQIGDTGAEFARDLIIDDSGNIYVVGIFTSTVIFGNDTMVPTGNNDIYISKMDSNGVYLWTKTIGGATSARIPDVEFDPYGNIILTGSFEGTVDFDPDTTSYNLINTTDANIFVCKLNSNGKFIWAHQVGSSLLDRGHSVTTDSIGSVYVAGFFSGTVDFDPGSSSFSMSSSLSRYDIFVLKLDSSGSFVWAKKAGSSSNDFPYDIEIDKQQNLYLTGIFHSNTDFDPNSGVQNVLSKGWSDVFVWKLDSVGNYVWAKGFGGRDFDTGYDLTLDDYGNVITVGTFEDVADFDPSADTFELTANGLWDIFISKLDTAGNFQWAKSIGGTSYEYGYKVTTDKDGNIYVTGDYRDTVDFDPDTGIYHLVSPKDNNAFLLKLDSSGSFQWVRDIGGNAGAFGETIRTDKNQNIYVGGSIYSGAPIYMGQGIDSITSKGSLDGFVLKVGPCEETIFKQLVTSCDSFIWNNGVTYFASTSTALDTLENIFGCDSIVQLNLTILSSSQSFVDSTVCDSFLWAIKGVTYTSTGTYFHTINNHLGCDSIITLNLTVDSSTNSTLDISTCDSYLWPQTNTLYFNSGSYFDTIPNAKGCDSILRLNLSINNSDTIIYQNSCDSFLWTQTNIMYLNSGIYKDTILNSFNCDSIITLDLTIDQSTVAIVRDTSCDSYTWFQNGKVYDTTGLYYDTILNRIGCDSIITLELIINKPTDSIIKDTSCNSYLWLHNGMTYNSTGIYYDTLINAIGCDSIIILDLTIHESTTDTISQSACYSYTWSQSGLTYDTSGLYYDTILNVVGCDSIIALDLIINDTTFSIDTIQTCNSYTWLQNGITYNASGLYYDTVSNLAGCDSIITLDLKVVKPTSSSFQLTSCDEYFWSQNGETYDSTGLYKDTMVNVAGCDSIVTLDLIINNSSKSSVVAKACSSFRWAQNGKTYITSGNYRDTIGNSNSCDSIVTLELTIDTITVSVNQDRDTLTARQMGAKYQWLDCNNGDTAITGATSRTFIAPANGSYSVEVKLNNCLDTSACYTVLAVGIEEENIDNNSFKVYPNPVNSLLTVEVDHVNDRLVFYDLSTKIVLTLLVKSEKSVVNISHLPKGVYMLKYGSHHRKIIVQ